MRFDVGLFSTRSKKFSRVDSWQEIGSEAETSAKILELLTGNVERRLRLAAMTCRAIDRRPLALEILYRRQ